MTGCVVIGSLEIGERGGKERPSRWTTIASKMKLERARGGFHYLRLPILLSDLPSRAFVLQGDVSRLRPACWQRWRLCGSFRLSAGQQGKGFALTDRAARDTTMYLVNLDRLVDHFCNLDPSPPYLERGISLHRASSQFVTFGSVHYGKPPGQALTEFFHRRRESASARHSQ